MLDGTMDAAVEASSALPPHSQSYDAPEDWGSMSELTELSDLDSDSDSDSSDDVHVFLSTDDFAFSHDF